MSDDEDTGKSKVKTIKPVEQKVNDDMGVIEKRGKDVEALLAKSNAKEAVVVAIAEPPLGSKNDAAKDVRLCVKYEF